MLLVVHLIMIVVLILLGILFHFGKGADLIAGYNTLPAEKKAEYDVKKLCKYMSKLMFATVYKGNIIKNLIMDCQSYTKYRPNETTGGIFVSWRRKEELPTGA